MTANVSPRAHQVGRRAAPLFSQLLLTMVAVALCAPLLHFLVVLLVRPAPPAYSLDAITSALGSGIAIGELQVEFASPPSPSQQDQHDRALSLALADRLGVEPSAVRVVVAKPSRPIDWQNSGAPEQTRNDVHRAVSSMEEMPNQIVDDFVAALHMGDGRWRVVRSSFDGIESRP
jgi:hypothetical protein